ncbi:MAG TPA: efflux RND transporter periplasmic adaptor subunit [Stellaceae bacterium]|nr:efflux RND transporter periplasmic adaptor subunit [Stellaceae bacterium]
MGCQGSATARLCLRLALSALIAPGALAISARAQPAPGTPPAVGVVRATPEAVTQTNEFIGRIQAVGRVSLVARVTAFLEKRLFVEGDEVKEGQLLYQLEQGPFQAQVDYSKATVAQLEAQHRNAELTLERAQYLVKTVAGQQSKVDQALADERSLAAQIAGAQAQLRQAEINLGYTRIWAPINGKISRTAVTEGNVVSPTSGTLATLVSQDPEYVIFPISLRTGLELRDRYAKIGGYRAVVIRLRLPTGKIYDQVGRLDYVSPTVAETTDTVTLRGVIANPVLPGLKAGDPGSRELTDGEFVTVLLQGVRPVSVLAIPRAAVLADQQGDYVYVLDAQDRARIRRIELGQSTPSTAVVSKGLTAGELVISEGLQRVRPGAVVSPGPATPAPALPPEIGSGGETGTGSTAASAASGAGTSGAADTSGRAAGAAKAGR